MADDTDKFLSEYMDSWILNQLRSSMKATDEELVHYAKLIQYRNQKQNSALNGFNDASPSVVIDDFLYHGDIYHASNMNLLKNLGIKHIVNSCDEKLRSEILENFNVLWINVVDDLDTDINRYFQQANDFLLSCKQKNEKVLVHCHMGISRSSSIVLAYLMKYHHDTLMKAYSYLLDRRPICSPNSSFLIQLIRYEKIQYSSGVIGEKQNNDDKQNPIKPIDLTSDSNN